MPASASLRPEYLLPLICQPRSTGYLVAYTRLNQDHPQLAQKMLQAERNVLIRNFGIKPARLKTVNGGYRKWRAVELWIVPAGEFAPFAPPRRVSKNRRGR